MYLNQFSVRVPEGTEVAGGYVQIAHGRQYRLTLGNNRPVRCDALVTIDGKVVGNWRIPAMQSITLERGTGDNGRFTAYVAHTSDGRTAEVDPTASETGLIQVEFVPEKPAPRPKVAPSMVLNSTFGDYTGSSPRPPLKGGISLRGSDMDTPRSFGLTEEAAVVGTGLSGRSDQTFGQADYIQPDYTQRTVINLRLINVEPEYTPRPLPQHSNPVPPPVGPRPLR